jgi:hypothetical protein
MTLFDCNTATRAAFQYVDSTSKTNGKSPIPLAILRPVARDISFCLDTADLIMPYKKASDKEQTSIQFIEPPTSVAIP